jgi:hypothetical protein
MLIGKADDGLDIGCRGRIDNTRRAAVSTRQKVTTVASNGLFGTVDSGVAKRMADRNEKGG